MVAQDYAVFGILFKTWYDALGFSAVSKVWAPLIGTETFDLSFLSAVGLDPGEVPIRYVLVPLIALVVTVYGVLGGLRAAYWTDLVQGTFIIILSVLLIPAGLSALVERFGDPDSMGLLAALMSSVDCGMLMISALVVRNGYAAYVNPHASERTYVFIGRVVGILAISLAAAEVFQEEFTTGGRAVYWSEGVEPVGKDRFSRRDLKEVSREQSDHELVLRQRYDGPTRGTGSFQVDFLIYDWLGVPLTERFSTATT